MSEQPEATKETVEQLSAARRRALAFQSVFGQESRRSVDQQIVIAHLSELAGIGTPVFTVNKLGDFDPLRAAHKDGAQTQIHAINRNLALARRLAASDKKPVKVKRK